MESDGSHFISNSLLIYSYFYLYFYSYICIYHYIFYLRFLYHYILTLHWFESSYIFNTLFFSFVNSFCLPFSLYFRSSNIWRYHCFLWQNKGLWRLRILNSGFIRVFGNIFNNLYTSHLHYPYYNLPSKPYNSPLMYLTILFSFLFWILSHKPAISGINLPHR